MRERELIDLIKRSAIFDESIIFFISKLISMKEQKNFIPFIYKRYRQCGCYPKLYDEEINIGMASETNIIEFMKNEDNKLDKFFLQKLGYELFERNRYLVSSIKDNENTIIGYYDYNVSRDNEERITFKFLLNNYGIDSLFPYSVILSRYDFDDYHYVKDFINYLFDLQLQNNGKQLNSEEMHNAMNNYCEKESVRTLKRTNNKLK